MTLATMPTTSTVLDGRYVLGECIGRGGMSTVYRAEDVHIGRSVAVKLIDAESAAHGAADRAHTEKALLSTLNHPSLVTLYEAHLDPTGPQYLVMELVEGPTLASRRVAKALSPRQLAGIVQGLAGGLAAVHAAGYVHRDVKPSNVLLSPPKDRPGGDWTAKLADFGIACRTDQDQQVSRGVVLGTLAYIAPEQLRGGDRVRRRMSSPSAWSRCRRSPGRSATRSSARTAVPRSTGSPRHPRSPSRSTRAGGRCSRG